MPLKIKSYLVDNQLLKNFFIYSFGAIFLKGIAFLLIPLYTEILTNEEYGQLELLNTLSTVLSVLLSFGFSQVLFIEYFHLDSVSKRQLVKILVSGACFIGLPLYIATAVILIPLTTRLFVENPGRLVFLLMFLFTFLSYFQAIYFVVLQITKKALNITIHKIVIGLLTAVANLVLVYYCKMQLLGIWITNAAIVALSVIYAFYHYKRLIGPALFFFDKELFLKYLKIGFPFIISSLSYWGLSAIDRWLLLYFLGEGPVGIYSLAIKFSSISEALMFGPILLVYTPYIFDRFARGIEKQNILLWFIGCLVIFPLVGLLVKFIAGWVINAKFYESLSYIMPLMIGYSFVFLAQLSSSKMVFLKKSKSLLTNVLIAGLTNILINILLISEYGLIGSVYAFVVSNLLWFLLCWYQSSKLSTVEAVKAQ